jgi:uncharacterized membrane protein
MQYQWIHVVEPERQCWVLRKNCAMSPRQLGICLGCAGLVCLAIAVAFATQGAWPVIGFAVVELAALSAAFVVYGRHAADYEKIVVDRQGVTVETASADDLSQVVLSAAWVRVEYRGGRRDLIRLVQGRRELSVGRFVPGDRRGALARELKATLSGWVQSYAVAE